MGWLNSTRIIGTLSSSVKGDTVPDGRIPAPIRPHACANQQQHLSEAMHKWYNRHWYYRADRPVERSSRDRVMPTPPGPGTTGRGGPGGPAAGAGGASTTTRTRPCKTRPCPSPGRSRIHASGVPGDHDGEPLPLHLLRVGFRRVPCCCTWAASWAARSGSLVGPRAIRRMSRNARVLGVISSTVADRRRDTPPRINGCRGVGWEGASPPSGRIIFAVSGIDAR